MKQWHIQVFATCLFCSHAAAAQTTPNAGESRGELLYSTHCIACHTTQIHWRDKRLATAWVSLTEQVRRWSSNTGLGWSEGDIVAVAKHLNTLYYHFPAAGGQMGTAAPERVASALPLPSGTMGKR